MILFAIINISNHIEPTGVQLIKLGPSKTITYSQISPLLYSKEEEINFLNLSLVILLLKTK